MYERILVPLDGSALAERAIHYARLIAGRVNGRIILFYVCNSGGYSEQQPRVYLEKRVEELQALGIEAAPVFTHGNAADEILDFAEKNDIGLIIMATHGRSGVSRWLLGSTSNKVIQESYVPLLLIKTGAMPTKSQPDESWKILVPLDGSKLSEAALSYAAGLANVSNSEIILFRVNEATEIPLYVTPEIIIGWETYLERIRVVTQESIKKYLAEVRGKLQSEGLNVRSEVAYGKAAEEIIAYVESHDISMITMTTHGRSGLSHWVFGSVANKVIHGTSKPVLLIRSRPKILNHDY